MTNGYDGDHLDFRGGEFTGPFTAKAEYHEHGPAPTALDALPARAVGFTGRDGELRALLDAFDPSAPERPAAVLVAAVSGLGGIGKTALAVEAAHEACGRGWFPGGVLFMDLHGYDDDPVTADQALEALLRALGTAPEHIPATADERAALYRSTLAERARERGAVLILADNASSPEQVRLLLPGNTRHRLLVTSRNKLPQLNARLLSLDELTPEEAYALLDRALRIADPSDSRVADGAEAAAELASRCGHLPLALQIAAALLVLDRDKPVAELVAELTEFRNRLTHLDDGERSVRAAFDLSYRRLPPEQARLLRLLSLAPGPDVSTEVVTVLTEADAPPTRALDALTRTHLVERGNGRGRWRLHDLVRAFGVGVVARVAGFREEGEAARERVLEFYYRWADAADDRLRWLPGMPEPERFADRAQALEWLDGERAGLVAAVQWAAEERYADAAVRLAACLAEYLEWRRSFDDGITVSRAAREAAHRAGDRHREGDAWNNLGLALWQMGRAEEAIDAHTRARDLYQATGNRYREGTAWTNLGLALWQAGRAEEAIDTLTRARDLYQATGNRYREGTAWTSLGLALQQAGRAEEAIDAHTRARDLLRTAGNRHHEGMAWGNLGLALEEAGRVGEAVEVYGKALEIFREFEDWYRAGHTLHNLALAHQVAHRPSDARACWLQAADAYTRANAPTEATQARTRAEEQL
ncbi:tetratricopeptide repeat protein [Streptomyces ureilyticus]|uniref:ATP-binding protein n=1 Tax=Streptomyces ureilyticus TaxID=1775131 RepID=A0ABX0E6Y4_9ACTN|nr:tetratricopeptide repeat protein [Streptomyces ureilyticus]NGO49372.1 ATP-binding protein [Streptomyces ureilyticus]